MGGMSHVIFDRALVRARRARAARDGGATFLLERTIDELEGRLGAVLRRFPVALDLASGSGLVAAALARAGKSDLVVRGDWRADGAGPDAPALLLDEEALPFAPESLDLVVSLLALHATNDLPGALLQIRRALRPDGLFIAALLGGDSLSELRASFAAAEAEREGGVSPRVAPFADLRDLGALLQRAGLALPVADADRVTVRYGHPLKLMADLRAMGWTNALVERRRRPLKRATLARALEIYQERYADGDGRVRATFDIVWLSGWAPHESQQKPLRPGSAAARLADALGTVEGSAGERAGG
jgi:SAM-dependent methyltransferase